MTKLTQKQENFCAAYVETGNASEAYRRAYDASRMKPESVAVSASKLMADPKVTLRVKELQSKAQERHQLTVDDLIEELEEARQMAASGERPAPAAMVAATMGKARLLGLGGPQRIALSGDKDGLPIKYTELTDADLERIAATGSA